MHLEPNHQMISNIDIGPTLAAIAGLSPPNLMDGRSLLPILIDHSLLPILSTNDRYDGFELESANDDRVGDGEQGGGAAAAGGHAEQGAEGPWRTHFVVEFAEAHAAYWGTNKMWNVTDADPTVDLEINPPWGPGCMTKVRCCVYNSMTKVGCCVYNSCVLPRVWVVYYIHLEPGPRRLATQLCCFLSSWSVVFVDFLSLLVCRV
jgi:hypothetical protein